MKERNKRRIAVLLFVLAVVAGCIGACDEDGQARRCYSQYEGCDATAEAISDAIATAEAQRK